MDWDKENAEVIYFKLIPINGMLIEIYKDRTIDFQLPLGTIIKREDVKLETFIDDLIQSNLVEKVRE